MGRPKGSKNKPKVFKSDAHMFSTPTVVQTPIIPTPAPNTAPLVKPPNQPGLMYSDSGIETINPDMPFIQMGRSGLKQYAGFVLEDFINQLHGQNAAKLFREIRDNSALVGGIMQQIELSMRQVEKYVEPYSDDQDDVDRAERFEQALDDMSHSWEETMTEIVSMIVYGYAPMEIVWKKCGGWTDDPTTRSRYDDGVIAPRKIYLLAQESIFRWQFDEEGGIAGLIQIPPPDYVIRELPIEKMLLFRPSFEKGNPEGRSTLRAAYWDWVLVKRLTEFEAISGERHATGIPVIYTPYQNLSANPTATQASSLAYAKTLVKNLRIDDQAGVVMPMAYDVSGHKLWELELLAPKGNVSEYDFDKVITRHEVRMAMAMLAGVAMLGHDKVGSFALAGTKWDTELAMGLDAWLDAIFGVLNRHFIPRFFKMNGWPLDKIFKLKHGNIKAQDIQKLADAALKLSQAGMGLFPDEQLENQIRTEAGWPEKPDDQDPTLMNENPLDPEMQLADEPDPNLQPLQPIPPSPIGKAKRVRSRSGAYAPKSGNVLSALSMLRDRQSKGMGDEIDHGFPSVEQVPFNPSKAWGQQVEEAPVERVKLKGLIATQPHVRREHVRSFLENPNKVSLGQRDMSGTLIDRPVIMRHGKSQYIMDGHHRLAAKQLLGDQETLARVIDYPADQGEPYNTGAQVDIVTKREA